MASVILQATLKFLKRFRRQRPATHQYSNPHHTTTKNKNKQQQPESAASSGFWKRRKLEFHSSSCHWKKLDMIASDDATRTIVLTPSRSEQEQELLMLPSIVMTPVGTGHGKNE
jgi:hypothetical protein